MKPRFADKKTHSIYEAKTHLSRLVDEAAKGREIVITKNGVPLAKIVAFPDAPKRRFGDLRGKVSYSDDIMKPLPEEMFDVFKEDR